MDPASEFSYCSLVALSLHRLYSPSQTSTCESDREFALSVAKLLLDHRKQPKQVHDTILAVVDGIGGDNPDPFVDILLNEATLHGSCLPILFDLLNLLIKDGCYDSRSRVLLKRVAWYLRVSWDTVEHIETTLAEYLKSKQYEITDDEEKETKKKERARKVKRYALIGLATVGGGALIGLTGGLAAPLIAAGAGAVIGGAGAAALGSAAGVAIIGSLFGVAGAGLTGYKMKKRVGKTEEFEFELLTSDECASCDTYPRQLHITIAVTGWLNSSVTDAKDPWTRLRNSHEQYSLRWESLYLIGLGNALDRIMSWGVTLAAQEALRYTVLSGLIAAIAWPATIVSAVGIIDNPWGVCTVRAKNTGLQLADVLLTRQQGKRPVTLIGYSLGARVIFYCLAEMAKRKGCEGIIEDVIMLGAPVSADVKRWQLFSRVVAGKVINGFSRSDWLLKFLYRTTSVQISVAGLESVRWDDRRMCNIDLSDLVSGHVDYRKKLHEILDTIGVKMAQKSYTLSNGILDTADDFVMVENTASDCLVDTDENTASYCLLDTHNNTASNCLLDTHENTASDCLVDTHGNTASDYLVTHEGVPANSGVKSCDNVNINDPAIQKCDAENSVILPEDGSSNDLHKPFQNESCCGFNQNGVALKNKSVPNVMTSMSALQNMAENVSINNCDVTNSEDNVSIQDNSAPKKIANPLENYYENYYGR